MALICGRDAIAAAIGGFDVVVKSPGISLYDPLVVKARADGVRFTSLLNLWFADAPTCRTICVTGTKGKSTTTALIAHILRGVGRNAVAAGNIGVPPPGAELILVPQADKLELRVRGPHVTPGYFRRPDLTEAAFDAEGFTRLVAGDTAVNRCW